MTKQKDVIKQGLAAVWDSGGRTFVTFEVAGDDDRFVQWIDGELNLRWPFDDDPASGLPRRGVRLPQSVTLRSFSRGGTAILGAWDLRIDDAVDLIAAVFHRVLAPGGGVEILSRVDAA